VDGHELARRAVVLDDRLRLLVVDREAALERLRRVVRPSLVGGATERTRPGDVVGEVEEEDHVQVAANRREHAVERLSLSMVAREAVEAEAAVGIGLAWAF